MNAVPAKPPRTGRYIRAVDDSSGPAGRVVAVRETDRETPATAPRWLERGQLDAVVVVEGVPLGDLPAGVRLRLGPTVVVELGPSAEASDVSRASLKPATTGGLLEADALALLPADVLEPGGVARGDRVSIEAVAIPLTDVLDLHSFRPEEIQRVLAAYLEEARRAGLDEVRIVHGRGRGVQRALVRRVLGVAPEVAGFGDAPPARGGWGATLVRLRRMEDSQSR